MKRDYPRLPVEDFGRQLIDSGDLDPVYLALNNVGWPAGQKLRWLTAYMAYYHCGVASYLSARASPDDFWWGMKDAAKNEIPAPNGGRWPRGHERRHFRGQQAVLAIEDWRARSPRPENMFGYFRDGAPSFEGVRDRALEYRSVGAWSSFKIVDLVDACLDGDIDQSNVQPFLYETPRQSAINIWRMKQSLPDISTPRDETAAVLQVIEHLREEWKDLFIPHKIGRPLDMFALETCLCKFGSHLNGHYPMYNDIDEINSGLAEWREHSDAVVQFHEAMPER